MANTQALINAGKDNATKHHEVVKVYHLAISSPARTRIIEVIAMHRVNRITHHPNPSNRGFYMPHYVKLP
jgi:hypothetical protein